MTSISVESMEGKLFLSGQWVGVDNTYDLFNAEKNSLITKIASARESHVLAAIRNGKAGAEVAAAMPVHERMRILHGAADVVESNRHVYIDAIVSEGCKTRREATKEVNRCIQTLRLSAEEARRINGETIAFDQMPGSEGRVGYYYRFPVGLIVAITPFNDPLNLVAHKIGPAVASGNAIIVKPAPATPLSALLLAEAFAQAGLPDGVLSVLPGFPEDMGDHLITHDDVRMISFTGGLSSGKALMQKAGLKKMSMELGASSPALVLDDAELGPAVEAIVSGAFWAAGQNCLGVQRVYVHRARYGEFLNTLVDRTRSLRVGSKQSEETDVGPMISLSEAERVESWVNEALANGARLLCGGERNGAFYLPTILEKVPGNCRLAREEIFGPVVMVEPFDSLDEAIDKANGVNFGLHAGVFTQDINKAFSAIRRLEVGGVMINDSSDYRIDAMPFGGVKHSGIGREGVKFSIQEMTETKVVCFKTSGF
jgi:glyceraldehyde-3-phosphate dehydrogenase (NADP+)